MQQRYVFLVRRSAHHQFNLRTSHVFDHLGRKSRPPNLQLVQVQFTKIDRLFRIFAEQKHHMNEITVTIIDREGVSHELVAPTDMSMNIMEVCKSYDLPVKGECGGMAMCATCQCYLESDTELPEQNDNELDMLDQAFFVKENSRLGCQIHVSEEIDGIVLRLAPEE